MANHTAAEGEVPLAPDAMIPTRGNVIPLVTGVSPTGERISLRDFYMRRNMAVVVVDSNDVGRQWLSLAALQSEAAAREAGVVVAIVPPGVDAPGVPTIVDPDGRLSSKLGLSPGHLPALFLIDRFGTLFATNVGASATPDLDPDGIPGWLEFIACRCS